MTAGAQPGMTVRGSVHLERVPLDQVPWDFLDGLPDRTVFQTREWLAFLEATQGGDPVVARVTCDGERVGYFTGLEVRKLGVKILGSPFRGWTTAYMGFNLLTDVPMSDLLPALRSFAYRDLGCHHLELMDRHFVLPAHNIGAFPYDEFRTSLVDVSLDEDQVAAQMSKSVAWSVRRAEREGVRIVEARDSDFADEYYSQLREVFGRQGLVPTYPVSRVRELIRHLQPAGRLLLLRAVDRHSRCIATGIFPATNQLMHFWGNASLREFSRAQPNEAIHWHAIRYWKARGVRRYDLGGGGHYKRKYGGVGVSTPWFYESRFNVLSRVRRASRRLVRLRQRVLGFLDRSRSNGH